LTAQIIESRPTGYGKEQAGDPRRWLALPVLLAGALLPILDFNVVNLAGVFYRALSGAGDLAAYAHAFTLAPGSNLILLILGGILSLGLADTTPKTS
jgi:hypothetical protein